MRVLISISNDQHREMIQQTISSQYQPVDFTDALSDVPPDLCLCDLASWHRVNQWLSHQNQTPTTCLLLLTETQIQELETHIEQLADDFLMIPFQREELNIRLRKLFFMKEQSERQNRINENLATLNKALESTSDAIIISDIGGVPTYINPAFNQLFGYSINELRVGGIPNILFYQPALGGEIFDRVREQGTWKGEVELVSKQRERLPFLLNINRIEDDNGEHIGFISTLTDITYHKRVDTLLEKQEILTRTQLNIAKALTSTLDISEVFERMLEYIFQVVPNDAANIILLDDGKVTLVDRNDYADEPQITQLKSGEKSVSAYADLQYILETNEPLIISDTRQFLAENSSMTMHSPWLSSHIGIPIQLQGEIIGFLNVDSLTPNMLTSIHAQQLKLFAEQAAIAIRNARLHARAQQLATLEERQRLARNLHDSVSQTLFSASIIADALPNLWQRDPEQVLPRLEQIHNLTRGALAEMRTLLLELHPERLLETEIADLLQLLVDGVLGQTQIDVTLDIQVASSLTDERRIAIYYITQEALHNVVKHSEAHQVIVQLSQEQENLSLMVRDDGNGFETDTIAATSLGLNNIQQRAKSTGADLTIQSEIGLGTTIAVRWLEGVGA